MELCDQEPLNSMVTDSSELRLQFRLPGAIHILLLILLGTVMIGCGGGAKKRNMIVYYETLEGKIMQIPLADRLLVKTENGTTRVVVINQDTEIKKDSDDAKFKDLKENEPVKIKGNTDPENNTFIAGSIDMGGDKVRPGGGLLNPSSNPAGGSTGH